MEVHDQPKPAAYEPPKVVDYGTLLELTRHGGLPNADVPMGANDSANTPS